MLGLLYSDYFSKDFKPKNEILASVLDCSKQTIAKAIKELKEENYLIIENPQGKFRKLKVNNELIEENRKDDLLLLEQEGLL